MTMEIIKNNPSEPWKWNWMSLNPNLTIEYINDNPHISWIWGCISQNPNIPIEKIEKNLNYPWNWIEISRNPNITIEMIEKNPNKHYFNWAGISENKFTKEKELFYEKYYRIYMATFRLQQYFNTMYDDPRYLFCKKRLEKVFLEY